MTKDELLNLAPDLSNWGRWGQDDEKGTTNFITADAILRGMRACRSGRSFSLAVPFDQNGPQTTGQAGRFNPLHYMMRDGGDAVSGAMVDIYWKGQEVETRSLDDLLVLPLQSGTQWDSLAHIGHRDVLYNDIPIGSVSSFGAAKLGIEKQAQGIASRGVLIDVAKLKGLPWLEPGTAVMPEDLDEALKNEGITLETGDIVLVRTGAMAKAKAQGWGDYAGGAAPGLGVECLRWIREHEIAAVAADTWALEVRPSPVDGVVVPFHLVAITYMGLTLGEIFDLEELARDCAKDGVYEGFFCAAPLPITGATGSPINPLFFK